MRTQREVRLWCGGWACAHEPANIFDDHDSEVFVNIMGQDMYSRAYTVEEIESYFQPLGLSLVKFNRNIHVSEKFGEEHVIEFIYQKT